MESFGLHTPTAGDTPPRRSRQLTGLFLVATGYFAGGVLAMAVLGTPAGFAAIWPPNAILLAALLLYPRSWWLVCVLAVVPAHLLLAALAQPPTTPVLTVLLLVGNAGQALLAAFLVRRSTDRPPRFDDLRSASRFIALGAVTAPAIVTTVMVLILPDPAADFWTAWWQRLMSNVAAALTFTPFIIVAFGQTLPSLRKASVRRMAELAGVAIAALGVSVLLGRNPTGPELAPIFLYALVPLLIWITVRFPPVGLYGCLLMVTLVCLPNAWVGSATFLGLAAPDSVLAIQIFIVAVAAPLMLLSTMVQDQRRTEAALLRSQQRYSMATRAGSVSVWEWNIRTGEFYIDPSLKALLGFAEHEIENTLPGWVAHLHPDDDEMVRAHAMEVVSGNAPLFDSEHRAIHRDGSIRWLHCRGRPTRHEEGVVVCITGTSTDITERKAAEDELRESNNRVRELAGRLISAQEEERRRIARDLHDDLNQKLAALAIGMSNVRRQLPYGERVQTDFDNLEERTASLVRDIRALSHELHPAVLEHAGLPPALSSFAAELKRVHAFDLRLVLPKQMPIIPRDVTTAYYRIAQEAIRNVVRHADTSVALLTLTVSDRKATLVVRDEGRGFDPSGVDEEGSGLGLISMRERVHLLGGRMDIESRPGAGTSVRVTAPISCRANPAVFDAVALRRRVIGEVTEAEEIPLE